MRSARVLIRVVAALTLAALLAAPGCKKKESTAELFDHVMNSGLGLGISFGQTPAQVHAVLGDPRYVTKRGTYTEEHYVPVLPDNVEPTMPDPDVPQFTAGYQDAKLVRVYNRYHPEDPSAIQPPFVAEPMPGAKLGDKHSQFDTALGKPNAGELKDEWRFESKDGAVITIQPKYFDVPGLGEQLCGTLAVNYDATGGSGSGRGEYYEKQKKKKEAIHELK